jgi:hypothetical protein
MSSELKKEKYAVKTFRHTVTCPECGEGELIDPYNLGLTHVTPDPAYLHKCNKCDFQISMAGSYPHLSYERIPEPGTTTLDFDGKDLGEVAE